MLTVFMFNSRLSVNTLTLLISNGGTALLVFLLSILIGRTLGANALGIYTTALAWIFPLALVADFGIGTLITRDIAHSPEHTADYVHQSTLARLTIGVVLTLMTLCVAPFLSDDHQIVQGIQISAPLITVMPFFGMFTAVFRAYRIMYPIALLNLGMLIIQLPLTIWVLGTGGDILSALAVNTITSTGQLLFAWAYYRHLIKPVTQSASTANQHTTYQLLRKAYPFAIAGILSALQLRVGIILLEQISDVSQVGYYGVANRFTEAVKMLPNALFGALLPALSSLIAQPNHLKQLFQRVMVAVGVFSLCSAIGLTIGGSWLINLTYGEQFSSALPVLALTGWSLLPSLLKSTRILYWYAHGQEQFVNYVTGVTVFIQIALSLWLIPQFNAIGLGLVLIVAETIGLCLLLMPKRTKSQLEAHVTTN